MKLRMVMLIGCLVIAGLSGCCRLTRPQGPLGVDKEFDIPPSLVWRMYQAQNAARDRQLRKNNAVHGEHFDVDEMLGLFAHGFTNAEEIAARPRGDMIFRYDGVLMESDRQEWWPFDVEAFEDELESKIVRDKDGLFRKLPESGEKLPTDANGLVAPNPTIRWVNDEIERWAVPQLDAKFLRLDNAAFCKVTGYDALPKEWLAWLLRDQNGVRECFVIVHGEGAWNPRHYMGLLCDDKGVTITASFDSFPNWDEAQAMRTFSWNDAAVHNLAVLEWRHRIFRTDMDPLRIMRRLSYSSRTYKTNLKVLCDHISEAK